MKDDLNFVLLHSHKSLMGVISVKLPVCWSCQYSFKWSELLFVIDGKKVCPGCKEKQFLPKATFLSSMWTPLLTTLGLTAVAWFTSFFTALAFGIGAVVLSFVISPFSITFTNKQKSA